MSMESVPINSLLIPGSEDPLKLLKEEVIEKCRKRQRELLMQIFKKNLPESLIRDYLDKYLAEYQTELKLTGF